MAEDPELPSPIVVDVDDAREDAQGRETIPRIANGTGESTSVDGAGLISAASNSASSGSLPMSGATALQPFRVPPLVTGRQATAPNAFGPAEATTTILSPQTIGSPTDQRQKHGFD